MDELKAAIRDGAWCPSGAVQAARAAMPGGSAAQRPRIAWPVIPTEQIPAPACFSENIPFGERFFSKNPYVLVSRQTQTVIAAYLSDITKGENTMNTKTNVRVGGLPLI